MNSSFSQIPYDWFDFRNHFGRYITYWGDIYSGTLWECPNYEESFFIVPNHNLREISGLTSDQRTPQKFRQLGKEIFDYRVIVYKYQVEVNTQEFNDNHGPTIGKSGQSFRDMFVFGAGASAHCCFGEPKANYEKDKFRSPLGYDIFNSRFEDIIKKYDGVQLAIPEFELKNNTIEECLEADWNKYSKYFMPDLTVRHINIQFYLQELFKEISKQVVSNYYRTNLYQLVAMRLLEMCSIDHDYRPVIVNFNYDTILDQFIEKQSGLKYNNIDDYIDWDKRSIVHFKPHGSCNWGWKFDEGIANKLGSTVHAELYDKKITPAQLFYKILGRYEEMVNYYSYGNELDSSVRRLGKHSLDKSQISLIKDEQAYPAMLLPFKEKDEFVMPYHHTTALKYVMPDVERLFVIGWKGSEQHFLETLKRMSKVKKIFVVNPAFEEVQNTLKPFINTAVEWIHIQDFEELIKKGTI